MIREVLLGIYGAGWLVAVVATVLRGETPDAELWAALGVGCGGILAIFGLDPRSRTKASQSKEGEDK